MKTFIDYREPNASIKVIKMDEEEAHGFGIHPRR